jgi:hypothetical protein
MSKDLALLDPLLDTRDVVETYLGDRLELPDWQITLRAASLRLADLAVSQRSPDIQRIANQLKEVADSGLQERLATLQSLSVEVAGLLEKIRVPGLPRPEDKDWSF